MLYPYTRRDEYNILELVVQLFVCGLRCSGQCGLWLDENLYHGRTQYCDTFYNEVLTGPETSGDFIIKRIECWAFEEA